ncbi:MAG TPA: hypothetical protein VHG89_08795 [Verrucomicrobiae bacterium]|nr:hypothetical protein [Verrucomicrobiae bacterium]
MNKISQWAGYSVSLLAILVVVFDGFARQMKSSTPGWIYGIMGICILLGGCLGVTCLATAFVGSLKERKKSN